MNNIQRRMIMTIAVLCALVSGTWAQALKVNWISHAQPEYLQVYQDTGARYGLATPIVHFELNGRALPELYLWTLTDRETSAGYVGLGVAQPLYQTTRFKMSLAVGWATAFSAGHRRGDGFAVGFQLAYKL